MPKRPLSRRLLLAMSLCLWAAAALALDHHGRRSPPPGVHDAIVVAGCRVMADGLPSPALERRTRHAVDLYFQGRAPRLVFTGGRGQAPVSEGEAAARLAQALGVPSEAIVVEDRSTSTEENAAYAASLLSRSGLDAARILVVSDSYHVFRVRRVFARHFGQVEAVGSAPAPYTRVKGSLREVLAVAGYAASGRLRRA
jgi:uncharacterized SAM-binding protein YcdF (DUF218 family)